MPSPDESPVLLQSWASNEEISNNAQTTNEAILMEGVGPPPWTPCLGLGFEIPSSKGVGEGTVALPGSPLPLVLVFQGQPRVGSAPCMGRGPSPASCTWPCCHEAPFLGGVHLFQTSHPTMGTSRVGATLPDCTSVYHTQASRERKGDRAPFSSGAGGGATVTPLCLDLVGGQGDTSGTPSHTRLAHPALPGC